MEIEIYLENLFEIEFDYQPEEKRMSDHPGWAASVEITSIKLFGFEVPTLVMAKLITDNNLIEKCLEHAEELRQEKGIQQRGYYKEAGE